MFLGTCRMHDPALVLRKDPRFYSRITPHRLHTPHQTLQFVKHMTSSQPYRKQDLHLLSDYAMKQIYEGTGRDAVWNELESLRTIWSRFDLFVIEISSLREWWLRDANGEMFYPNTFSRRDIEIYRPQIEAQVASGEAAPIHEINYHRLTTANVVDVMRRIRDQLGNHNIVWVSHMRPPSDAPQFSTVNAVRKALADVIQLGASRLGDKFFDPSEVAAEVGQRDFFMKDGEDLDHLTPLAAERLAQVYAAFALRR